jgi:hypothetical protein
MFPSQLCPASAYQDRRILTYPGDCFFLPDCAGLGVVAKVVIFLAKFCHVPVAVTLGAVVLAGLINRRQITED